MTIKAYKDINLCFDRLKQEQDMMVDIPNAPPISAPLVGMLTFTIPQSEPLGLKTETEQ